MDSMITIYLILFALVSVIYLYNWIQAISQTKEIINPLMFFNWTYLFDSEIFNDAGNKYRKNALICFILLFIILILMGISS
jgi:hypothetical protein